MINFVLTIFFRVHDALSEFFARYFLSIKKTLLIVAHLSLFGFLFPEMREDLGNVAILLLSTILLVSPLSKIFRIRLLLQVMSVRRELGIWMAYVAIVHGSSYLMDPLWVSRYITPYLNTSLFSIDFRYLVGIAAYLLTLPLLLTSNNFSVKFLGPKIWKGLHRIVYLLFFFVLLHFFLRAGRTDILGAVAAVLAFSCYIFIKILARNNFIPLLRDFISFVAERYRAYSVSRASSPTS